MPFSLLKCSYCGKRVLRSLKRINESKKFGWKIFCSNRCLGLSKRKLVSFVCANPACNKVFQRNPSDSKKSKNFYCSLRCAALVNNYKYPKNRGVLKICAYCGKNFKSRKKYCSRLCKDKGETVSGKDIIVLIQKFFVENGRIPFRNEFTHARAARFRFGTWNNAIKAAGFKTNPVMFAKKYIANDGDKCDSLAEKIIDDWLNARKIKHLRNFHYPGNEGFTVDFKVGDFWIEFFGLSGQLRRYDQLKRRKLKLAKKYKLNLIQIYPKDIFPLNKGKFLPLEFLDR